MSKFCLIPERIERNLEHKDVATKAHFYSAVNVPRLKLQDQVHGTPAQLAKRVKKFLSLNPEYADGANTRFWAMVNNTKQHLPTTISGTRQGRSGMEAWSYHLFTSQRHPLPFESGPGVLPGMEKFVAHGGRLASYNEGMK